MRFRRLFCHGIPVPSRVALTILMLMFAFLSFAQERLFTNQQHYGVDDGLPQSYVMGIKQDDDGFIWLATLDGLCRYDGRNFKIFRASPSDTTGLTASSLLGMGKLENNLLTLYYSPIATDEFNLRTFKTTPNTVRNQLAAMKGIRWQSYRFSYTSPNWFFTLDSIKGVGWINSLTGSVHYATKANGKLHTDTVSAITQSKEGRIYLVHENGVHVSDTARENFVWHEFYTGMKPNWTTLPDNRYGEPFSVVAFGNNKLALIENNVLTILNIDEKTRRVIPLPTPRPNAVNGHDGLQVDAYGRAYFEYFGGIYRITEDDQIKLLWQSGENPLRISAFFIDRTDVLWLSLNAQGLLKIDLKASHFESYKYKNGFLQEVQGWMGFPSTPLPKLYQHPEASYYFRQAWDKNNNLYSSSTWYESATIYQWTPEGLRPFPHSPKEGNFQALVIRNNGQFWAFNRRNVSWYVWDNPDAVPQIFPQDSMEFVDVELADAKEIGGYIWVSTYMHGLFQFKDEKLVGKFAGRVGKTNVIKTLTEICRDPVDSNRFWVGSRSGGLMLWDAHKGLQRIYTMDDGLPNNTIYCILPDKKGRIWCSTNRGIFRLDPTTGLITAFEKTDGLQNNEFNRAHKFVLPDGRLVFGGLDGYTIIDPDKLETDNKGNENVPLVLTGFQINNEPQDVNIANSIIKDPLSTLTRIELPYDKNYLRFEFAALVFNQPQRTRYRYQLEGVDNGWVENNYSNVASYSALAPGSYTFRINATDDNGRWSDYIREIDITIRPPFWNTWWARALYIFLAGVLISRYFIFREKRLQIQQNLAFEKREAIRLREVDELKDRFFSNVTHEFRTPLTLIITPLEKLEQDPTLSPAAMSNIKTAQKNSKQLLRLINEFLDFSKLNDGQMKLKTTAGELAVFTADSVSSFDMAAKEKNIALQFSVKQVEGYYLFDGDKWEKIVTNLLSNALKFTPAGGAVSVELISSEDEMIQFIVSDNGPGVPSHLHEKIFSRFYQVDDSSVRTYGGTGIGLSLVKELVELMNGEIELDSEPRKLTRFIVTVPMQKVEQADATTSTNVSLVEIHNSNGVDANAPLILIVEDNDELRSFLVESMRRYYRVLEAPDGLKAWDLILEEMPDLVISDVMMPGQDGFDLCRACKSDARTAHIGFILLTSKVAHEARLRGLGMGADDYINKPFSLAELELRSANFLQLQQKQRAWLQSQLIHHAPADPLPVVTDPFLVKLYAEMDRKLEDPELGVDYLCRVMAMSRSTLNRKLKSLLNTSTNDLIRQYRLQKAASLITGGLDISSAAYQVGFSSPSYFSQCFKEKYGVTPSDWVSEHS